MATESKFGLFSDVFLVTNKNPDDKKFDRVDRILAEGEETEIILTLDVNTEIYPIESDDRYTFLLASSLALDDDHNMTDGGSSRMAWRKNISSAANGREEPPTLADAYDYVMYGKVYNFDDEDTKASVYASFGGLLMCLSGASRHLQNLNVGQNIYLLMKRVDL